MSTIVIRDVFDRPVEFTADQLADAYCCTAFGYEAQAVRKAFTALAAADALADDYEAAIDTMERYAVFVPAMLAARRRHLAAYRAARNSEANNDPDWVAELMAGGGDGD